MRPPTTSPSQSTPIPWKLWSLGGAAIAGWWLLPHPHGDNGLLGAMVLGLGGLWLWRQQRRLPGIAPIKIPKTLTRAEVETALVDAAQRIETLAQAGSSLPSEAIESWVAPLRDRLALLQLDRQQLAVLIMGDRGVGKTTLSDRLSQSDLLPQTWPITWVEQSLSESEQPEALALNADLGLLVLQGDLRASELAILKQLDQAGLPLIVLVNKIDQWVDSQWHQLQNHLQQALAAYPQVIALHPIAANPNPIKVRRLDADGQAQETLEAQPANLTALAPTLTECLAPEACASLVLRQTYRAIAQLNRDTQQVLHQVRRQQAQPILERYQWLNAGTTFASPFPTIDLIATAAITGKLVSELGELYGHRFSLTDAQEIATVLADSILKLGIIDISSQWVGSILKSHAFTYVAGGLVQGASAAYLTQLAGLSLMEYFEAIALSTDPMATPSESRSAAQLLPGILAQVCQQHHRLEVVQRIVDQALGRLQPSTH